MISMGSGNVKFPEGFIPNQIIDTLILCLLPSSRGHETYKMAVALVKLSNILS